MSGEAHIHTPPLASTSGPNPSEQKGHLVATSKAINTDWFASNISPTNPPCVHKLLIRLATTAIVTIYLDDGATTDLALQLNAGVALTLNVLYAFDIPLLSGQTYNIQHDTGTQNIFCTIIEHQEYGW